MSNRVIDDTVRTKFDNIESSWPDQTFLNWIEEPICLCKVPYASTFSKICLNCGLCHSGEWRRTVCNCEMPFPDNDDIDSIEEICLECDGLIIFHDLTVTECVDVVDWYWSCFE